MSKETGGAAFPTYHDRDPFRGMTLRDYFAAKVMQASIQAFGYKGEDGNNVIPSAIPSYAYQLADEMLKAREQ